MIWYEVFYRHGLSLYLSCEGELQIALQLTHVHIFYILGVGMEK